jgi:excinuclease ABC subunit A
VPEFLTVRGARQHNLQGVDVAIPRGTLCAFTGVSGSGKSSLAFDTIYAEGRRRYVESLSAYARQFLGQLDRPEVEEITGLSPAIAIDQGAGGRSPRSTVGTVTEIHDHLRLLYARVGRPHCPRCGRPVEALTVSQMVDRALGLGEGARVLVLAPLPRERRGTAAAALAALRREGFVRVRVDGTVHEIEEAGAAVRGGSQRLEAVVDRLTLRPGVEARLAEALETACRVSEGVAMLQVVGGEGPPAPEVTWRERPVCPDCGLALPELTPRLFSFNNPTGACPQCGGLGARLEVDPDLVLPDAGRSLAEGAVAPWAGRDNHYTRLLEAVAAHAGLAPDQPLDQGPPGFLQQLLHGGGDPVPYEAPRGWWDGGRHHRPGRHMVRWEGMVPLLRRLHGEAAEGSALAEEIESVMVAVPCAGCGGRRLRPEALAVTVGGRSIAEVAALPIRAALAFVEALEQPEGLAGRERLIARRLCEELRARLRFLLDVGLPYLSLDRPAASLSGGEAQRIRLATQIGSGLAGVLYVLDEPSAGLHPRDNERLLGTLRGLRDLGNTLIVVEHDEDTIRAADFVVDVGPGAGPHGGRIVVAGTVADVAACPASVTGAFLSGRRRIAPPARRRGAPERWISVRGAAEHNLREIDVDFPLARFTVVTGVSGSGKSSLVDDILRPAIAAACGAVHARPGRHAAVLGLEHCRKVIAVDQAPLGRTPRGNPATYTGAFDEIRDLFARTPEARARGYGPGRFSFNLRGGRCEACGGDGVVRVEMQFLPDVYVTCEVCAGRRYNRETLEVRYRGLSVADVLDRTAEAALDVFSAVPGLRRRLQALVDVGLGYVRLGQPSNTLSGGEAQRVRLAAELARRTAGGTVYILDEPTTGLHCADVERLLHVLQRLVDAGDSVVVIEHHPDVVRCADWVIDLGPEGGDAGGRLVVAGTPEEVAACPASHTGRHLARRLGVAAGDN